VWVPLALIGAITWAIGELIWIVAPPENAAAVGGQIATHAPPLGRQ
jgi:hypothetical protein